MPTLGSHTNVYNTCLNLIRKAGFDLSIEDGWKNYLFEGCWRARKNDFQCKAQNPIELLGLCALYQANGEPHTEAENEWWNTPDDKDLYTELVATSKVDKGYDDNDESVPEPTEP